MQIFVVATLLFALLTNYKIKYNSNMKIIALRHGEKDKEGNLTSHGREMSQNLGARIALLHNPVAVSSSTPRVRDTVSALLE